MRWKRTRRRGVSVGRIAVWVVLLGTATAFALWRARPLPLPTYPVGAERVVTPSLDLATEEARRTVQKVRALSAAFGTTPLVDECFAHAGTERYVLLDGGDGGSPPPRRTEVTLEEGGEVRHARYPSGFGRAPESSYRSFGHVEAERFRELLLEGEMPAMTPDWRPVADCDAPVITFESCVRGRYYAVARVCDSGSAEPTLSSLAHAIESFAAPR